MSLKNPFVWKDANKISEKEAVVLPEVNKRSLINTDFMTNTKIKSINDQIGTYNYKTMKMLSELQNKEQELAYKEKLLKEQQRRMSSLAKSANTKKQFNAMNDEKKAEDKYEKKVKEVSELSSCNNQNRLQIESLRKEKNTYKNINDKLEKELENLKRNFDIANTQLSDLAVNRKTLGNKIDEEFKAIEKDKELAVLGLLTMQQKLHNENKRAKNNSNMTKKSGLNSKNVTFNKKDQLYDIMDPLVTNQHENGTEQTTKPEGHDVDKMNESKTSAFDNKLANKTRYTVNTIKSNNSRDTKNTIQDLETQEKKAKYRLEELANLFKVLFEVTNTNNITDLTDYYLALEEENKELYKETKLLIDEMDKMKDHKLAMQLEIKNAAKNSDKFIGIKENIIGEIEQKVNNACDKLKRIETRKEQYNKLVNELKLALPVILQKLAFEGESVEITPNSVDRQNLSQYLYVLERKTNFILKLVKENKLESHIFDSGFNNPKEIKSDEFKWKNDLNVLEDLLSKFIRIWLSREKR